MAHGLDYGLDAELVARIAVARKMREREADDLGLAAYEHVTEQLNDLRDGELPDREAMCELLLAVLDLIAVDEVLAYPQAMRPLRAVLRECAATAEWRRPGYAGV